jgi:2-polyprenyl-3-methyl-5-hydroxy-6-metoxy-1,4-benzoquinol methylase
MAKLYHRTAITRDKPSVPVRHLLKHELIVGSVLDFGCGQGHDCDAHGWDGYDPNTIRLEYSTLDKTKRYDTILCTYVLNVVPPDIQVDIIKNISRLMKPDSVAYLTVRRDIPEHMEGEGQWTVVLPFSSIRKNKSYEIYAMRLKEREKHESLRSDCNRA